MSIRDTLINDLASKYVIVMAGEETLSEAAENFYALQEEDPEATEYNTFLVVAEAPDRYKVALFCELSQLLIGLPPAGLGSSSLAELPIPPATEIIPRDTSEAGGKVRDRLKHSPGAVFIIVDGNGFVCLFANPERGGGTSGAASTFRNLFPQVPPPTPKKRLTCTRGHTRVYFKTEFIGGSRACRLHPPCTGTVTW